MFFQLRVIQIFSCLKVLPVYSKPLNLICNYSFSSNVRCNAEFSFSSIYSARKSNLILLISCPLNFSKHITIRCIYTVEIHYRVHSLDVEKFQPKDLCQTSSAGLNSKEKKIIGKSTNSSWQAYHQRLISGRGSIGQCLNFSSLSFFNCILVCHHFLNSANSLASSFYLPDFWGFIPNLCILVPCSLTYSR